MKITRITTGPDGKTRFEDEDIALSDRGKFGWMSELQASPGIVFREMPRDYDSGWHTVPGRLYLVILGGSVEIEVGSGENRQFSTGAIIRPEDMDGTGHRTRAVGGVPVRSLLVNLS